MADGAAVGMALGDARAILPAGSARIEQFQPESVAIKLRALAAWANRLAPTVAVDPPDGLLLDITGCERVWKGEPMLMARLTRGFAGLGVRTRSAIAPTFGAAWALARFANDRTIAVDGEQSSLLAPMPTAALRLEAPCVADLATLGIDRVEHLLALPRRTLPARFGPSVLLRLDQAMGEAIETIDPVRPVDPPQAHRLFDGPTPSLEAIELTVRELLYELCARLASLESGATRLRIELLRSDLEPAAIGAQLSRPSREPRHLWAIVRPKLERVHLGFGVEGVSITALHLCRIDHEQARCWDAPPQQAVKAEGELLDALTARLGDRRVMRATLHASHLPERAFRWASVLTTSRPGAAAEPPPLGDRPTVLFDSPVEVRVLSVFPDGPVASMMIAGQDHTIEQSIGPERIGPEWWEGDRQTRDYFKVCDDRGRWLWLFRESETGCWHVHGVWA